MNTGQYWEEQAKRSSNRLSGEELFANYWTKRYLDNLRYLKDGDIKNHRTH